MLTHLSIRRSNVVLLTLCISVCIAETTTPNTGDQVQSFLFGFTNSHLVVPVTSSCPTPLTLTQLTTTNAKTSDPAAPYTMIALVHEQLLDGAGTQYERLYSASMNVGDMSQTKEIAHPWMNGTQFIACIWGSNGASGGCQDLYTVVPNERTFEAYEKPEEGCRAANMLESWVPPSNETLDVEVTGLSGAVSWNAWPASCSDLKIIPKNGTAPYTLLVAPASHPPVNISSASSGDVSMNYTVRLTHGQPFMLALYDSAGASWAFGPLHAGAGDDLACLSTATGQIAKTGKTGGIPTAALAGGVVGAFLVGALGALGLAWFLGRGKKGVRRSPSEDDLYANPRPASYRTASDTLSLKPFSPSNNNSPSIDFDTPATLYDPHVAGPHGSASDYPKPPNGHVQNANSSPRVFPRPPALGFGLGSESYTNPYEGDGYRDSFGLADFRPAGATSGAGDGAAHGHESLHSVQRSSSSNVTPRRQGSLHGQHTQDSSWAGSASSRTAPRRSGGLPGPTTPTSGGLALQHPSSPRPDSFGSHSGSFQTPRGGDRDRGDDDDTTSPPSSPASRRLRNVYVVHSDGGGGDVHIQLPDLNARVIELPPNYQLGPEPGLNPNSNPSPLPSPGLSIRNAEDNGARDSSPNTNIMKINTRSTPALAPAPAPPAGRETGAGAGIEPTRSRNSGISNSGLSATNASVTNSVGEDELRARAEAAMREKMRPLRSG